MILLFRVAPDPYIRFKPSTQMRGEILLRFSPSLIIPDATFTVFAPLQLTRIISLFACLKCKHFSRFLLPCKVVFDLLFRSAVRTGLP